MKQYKDERENASRPHLVSETHLAVGLDTVLEAEELPGSISDLDSGLGGERGARL